MTDKLKNSINFVARHYSDEAFTDRRGRWSGALLRSPWWRRRPIAAAITVAAVLAATAAGGYLISVYRSETPAPAPAPAVQPTAPAAAPVDTVTADSRLVLEFTDAPLPDVCVAIEEAYGVTLTDLPVTSDETLTLSYEGNAYDLVATVNELLGTHIRIK